MGASLWESPHPCAGVRSEMEKVHPCCTEKKATTFPGQSPLIPTAYLAEVLTGLDVGRLLCNRS